ncbi:MAG: hypothetical protein JRG73_20155 [Deltaproteobacteria bacterium]|nr:hypothetical protein [Deltaproteobacteria bacterium]
MKKVIINRWVLLGFFSFISTGIIFAAPGANIPRLLKEARVLYERGDYFESYLKLGEASFDVWTKCPLILNNVQFVVDEPDGFGIYTPRANAIFKQGEKIRIYMEPVGFTIKDRGEFKELSLSTDFNILDTEGNVLAGKRDFGRWTMKSRAYNTQFMLKLNYSLTGAPPGRYKIETVVKDNFSAKRASVIQDIEIVQ